MGYRKIDAGISLDDPETGFSFRKVDGHVLLSYRDWQNDLVVIKLRNVWRFSYALFTTLPDAAAGQFCEIDDSEVIAELRADGRLGDEKLRHFLISTNEGEWCEALAEGYEMADLGELVAE